MYMPFCWTVFLLIFIALIWPQSSRRPLSVCVSMADSHSAVRRLHRPCFVCPSNCASIAFRFIVVVTTAAAAASRKAERWAAPRSDGRCHPAQWSSGGGSGSDLLATLHTQRKRGDRELGSQSSRVESSRLASSRHQRMTMAAAGSAASPVATAVRRACRMLRVESGAPGMVSQVQSLIGCAANSQPSAHTRSDRCCCCALHSSALPVRLPPLLPLAAPLPLPPAPTMLAVHSGAFAPPMSNSDLPLSATPTMARGVGTAASVPASPAHAHTPARRRMSICGE